VKQPKHKILLSDDHPLFRRGLKLLLSIECDVSVVHEASTARETLERVRSEPWDVLLQDISLPDGSGIDLLRQIRGKLPALPILMLSSHDEQQYAVNLLQAGASGYIMKDADPELIVHAVRTVLTGKKYISAAVADMLINDMDGDRSVHEQLNEREFQIFCKLVNGAKVGEIADELFLSSKTVSTYRGRIMDKMRARANTDLAHYAIKHGLI
jgi:two-component system, NarL family, invasion response regulator UvrY